MLRTSNPRKVAAFRKEQEHENAVRSALLAWPAWTSEVALPLVFAILMVCGCVTFGTKKTLSASAEKNLLTQLLDENPSKRCDAIKKLAATGEVRYVRIFETMTEDSNPLVRCAAVRAIGKCGDVSESVDCLIKALEDPHYLVRWDAIDVLADHQNARVTRAIARRLSDRKDDVRLAAAKALAKAHDLSAVRPLVQALSDRDESVRFAAEQSLKKLTGQDFGEDRRKWQQWYEKMSRRTQVEERK